MKHFYKNTKWKGKRGRILKRDEYLYRECKRYGKSVAAKIQFIMLFLWSKDQILSMQVIT